MPHICPKAPLAAAHLPSKVQELGSAVKLPGGGERDSSSQLGHGRLPELSRVVHTYTNK
jgi:hypothetical protein